MVIPAGHTLLDRVIADKATDPAGWADARRFRIGASDAAKFAKVESTELYVRSAVLAMHKPWNGNEHSRRGHEYEPAIAGYVGLGHNERMFRSAEFDEFAATPDAIHVADAGVVVNGEYKVKHRPIKGPSAAEFRQVWWAQMVTGAAFTRWAWLTLDDRLRPIGPPQTITIDRDEQQIQRLLTIAHPVRLALRQARTIMENR